VTHASFIQRSYGHNLISDTC